MRRTAENMIVNWNEQYDKEAGRVEYAPGRFYSSPAMYAVGNAHVESGMLDAKGRPIGASLEFYQSTPTSLVQSNVHVTRDGIIFGARPRSHQHNTIEGAKKSAEGRAQDAFNRYAKTQ
jgi:hypothetical protein